MVELKNSIINTCYNNRPSYREEISTHNPDRADNKQQATRRIINRRTNEKKLINKGSVDKAYETIVNRSSSQ